MGTLQTEIERTLHAWEKPQERMATVPRVKEPVAKQVFDYVRINPSCQANDVVRDLKFSLGKVSAILLGLYERGKVNRKEYPNTNPNAKRSKIFCYWTEVNNYSDKGVSRKAKKVKEPSMAKRLLKELEEPAIQKRPLPAPVDLQEAFQQAVADKDPQSRTASVKRFVHGLNVHDAKFAYELLRDIFK